MIKVGISDIKNHGNYYICTIDRLDTFREQEFLLADVGDFVYWYGDSLNILTIGDIYSKTLDNIVCKLDCVVCQEDLYPGNAVLRPAAQGYHYVQGISDEFQDLLFDAIGTIGTVTQDKNYVHTQTSQDTSWYITHGLGKRYVSVEVYDELGEIIFFDRIDFVDDNNIIIHFTIPATGVAIIN